MPGFWETIQAFADKDNERRNRIVDREMQLAQMSGQFAQQDAANAINYGQMAQTGLFQNSQLANERAKLEQDNSQFNVTAALTNDSNNETARNNWNQSIADNAQLAQSADIANQNTALGEEQLRASLYTANEANNVDIYKTIIAGKIAKNQQLDDNEYDWVKTQASTQLEQAKMKLDKYRIDVETAVAAEESRLKALALDHQITDDAAKNAIEQSKATAAASLAATQAKYESQYRTVTTALQALEIGRQY